MLLPMPIVSKQDFDTAKLFIKSDIGREIDLAKATADPTRAGHLQSAGVGLGGGNFLAALGLLCYTEFGGWLKFDERFPAGHPRAGQSKATENFNKFFDYLGAPYTAFRTQHKVYDIFRCGLAHEYFAKLSDYTIHAIDGGGMTMGITHDPGTGRFTFNVEKYQADLLAAFDRLETELSFPLQR